MKLKSQSIFCRMVAVCMLGQMSFLAAANNHEPSIINSVNIVLLILLAVIGVMIVKAKNNAKALKKLQSQVKYLRRTDELTQLYNKRYLEKRLYEIFERHLRNTSSNSVLLMIGLDNFQSMIKDYGQSAGDLVVKNTAELILDRIRNTDLCGRFTEDTFLVLLRDTTTEPAKKLAEQIREKLQNTETGYGEQKLFITCSIGLAAHSQRMMSCRDWIQQADQALNRAKQLGKNQITVY